MEKKKLKKKKTGKTLFTFSCVSLATSIKLRGESFKFLQKFKRIIYKLFVIYYICHLGIPAVWYEIYAGHQNPV